MLVPRLWSQFQTVKYYQLYPTHGTALGRHTHAHRRREFTAGELSTDIAVATGTIISWQSVNRRLTVKYIYSRRWMISFPFSKPQERFRIFVEPGMPGFDTISVTAQGYGAEIL
ncbi:hypothetical protein AVEN_40709-1 [Araneus ventricosus]|uniref:Uncharacterized protein n=1 Tax=Araneus ventricosus TaxID=182803 RepID=A0A4Y2JGV4_ARAVE|nr:hypothetical protein AVEN_40709-1 [Araneus ventricosus]